MICEVEITHMGREGEGAAAADGRPVYVPFTLPRELAEISLREGGQGELLKLLRPSPERQPPLCRHFGRCGGCLLQHWRQAPYQAWKRGLIGQALAQAGAPAAEDCLAGLFAVPAGGRRRLVLSAGRQSGQPVLGFNRAQSHEIIAVEECPVAAPELTAALPVLRRLPALLRARRKNFHIVVTQAENGLDIALQGLPDLTEAEKLRLADFFLQAQRQSRAGAAKFLRLTADGEIIAETAKPFVHFGAVKVELPFGGFLQAAKAAEEHMAALAAQALRKCKNVADLFAGCGSFTFRLAEYANIHAVEQDKAALAALAQAAAAAGGGQQRLKNITYAERDLYRQPLTAKELAAYDGLLFDPPRAGAEAQAREIAKAQVPIVVAVSCNPATLARDMRILQQGGYKLQMLAPIDQFLWSPHIEAVAVLTKRRQKKGWIL